MLASNARRWLPLRLKARAAEFIPDGEKPSTDRVWARYKANADRSVPECVAKFSLRVVYIDYYMAEKIYFPDEKDDAIVLDASPGGGFMVSGLQPRQTSASASGQRQPVIRIYGRTPMGQSACVHVHECFPYFFVHVPAKLDFDGFANTLKDGINDAFMTGKNRDLVIYAAYYVDGFHMYGYKQDQDRFLKIEVYNPDRVSSIVKYLKSRQLLNHCFMTFESHINYIMHFMSDYNIVGMGFMNLANFTFRSPLPEESDAETLGVSASSNPTWNPTTGINSRVWTKDLSEMESVPVQFTAREYPEFDKMDKHYSSVKFPMRQCSGTCQLELDAPVFAITNVYANKSLDSSSVKLLSSSVGTTASERVIASLDAWWDEMSKFVDKATDGDAGGFSLSPTQADTQNYYQDKDTEKHKLLLEKWLGIGNNHGMSQDQVVPSSQEALQALRLMEGRDKESDDSSVSDAEAEEWVDTDKEVPIHVKRAAGRMEEAKGNELDNGRRMPALPELKEMENMVTTQMHGEEWEDIRCTQSQNESQSQSESQCFAQDDHDNDEDMVDGSDVMDDALDVENNEIEPTADRSCMLESIVEEVEGPQENVLRASQELAAEACPYKVGEGVECTFRGGNQYFAGKILRIHSATVVDIVFDKSNYEEKNVSVDNIRKKPAPVTPLVPQLDGLADEDLSQDSGEPSQNIPTQVVHGQAAYFRPVLPPPSPSAFPQHTPPQTPFFTEEEDFRINQTDHFRRGEKIRRADPNYSTPILLPKKRQQQPGSRPGNRRRLPLCIQPEQPPPSAHTLKRKRTGELQRKSTEAQGSFKVDEGAAAQVRTMVIEIVARSRNGRRPDPREDPVIGIVLCVSGVGLSSTVDKICITPAGLDVEEVLLKERKLFDWLIRWIWTYDPDIIAAFELQRTSLGYLLDRAKTLGLKSFPRKLSRAIYGPQDKRHDADAWGAQSHSGFWLTGRHVLNVWRIVRQEADLSQYSLQFVVLSFLKEHFPRYSNRVVQGWMNEARTQDHAVQHLLATVHVTLRIMEHLDIVVRTSEFSQFVGADFFSVLTRGSQFRVESVLVRLSKRFNFLLVSPTPEERANQPALEEIALTLEPKSRMYIHPTAVFDFRSLYPSIVIAYNLCFSTYLGRVQSLNCPMNPQLGIYKEFDHETKDRVKQMYVRNQLYIAPTGAIFVKDCVRPGILPLMLKEILDTRFRVKLAMKTTKADRNHAWTRVLNARQLALKLTANVTYGYTAASFSGRMPCAELADAIVRLGRCSLLQAYGRIQKDWQDTEVVYGDTDSAFVHMKGRSTSEAFKLSKEIAFEVSKVYPEPMKLQFEKVYHPCLLQMRKRYCGVIYESAKEIGRPPKLEVKGMEMMRRDSAPLVQRVLRECLMKLFIDRDLTQVRKIFNRHVESIMSNRVCIRDYIVASKVKQGTYKNLPPSAVVAKRRQMIDPMDFPLFKERVPYIIVEGSQGKMRLTDLVSEPRFDSVINARYYIERKILKPLDRMFLLVGVDVYAWWTNLRKIPSRDRSPFPKPSAAKPAVIESYLNSESCQLCRERTKGDLCEQCTGNGPAAVLALEIKKRYVERKAHAYLQLCRKCDPGRGQHCNSTDCDVYYKRSTALEHYNW